MHLYHVQPLSAHVFRGTRLVQDCSNPSALAMELLQACAKPSVSHSVVTMGVFSI